MPLGAFKAALMGTAGATVAGDVVLLSTTTASNSATASITSGITSTYGEYIFKFYNMNAASDNTDFKFQVESAGTTGYDETMTTTWFRAYHYEDGSSGQALGYVAGNDLAQGTSFQHLIDQVGNGSDENVAGELHLFNPASTTYVKHFYGTFVTNGQDNQAVNSYVAGYINTTTAIDAIQFKMAAGNFDGTIKMWGVK